MKYFLATVVPAIALVTGCHRQPSEAELRQQKDTETAAHRKTREAIAKNQ